MIILSSGITGNSADGLSSVAGAGVFGSPGWAGRGFRLQPRPSTQVVHADHDYATHIRQDRRWMAARLGVPAHVVHLAGIALREPVRESLETVGGQSCGDAGQLEAKIQGTLLYLRLQRRHNLIISQRWWFV